MSGRSALGDRLRRLPRDLGYFHGPRLMSALRKAWVKARHPHATVVFGPGTYLGPGFRLHAPERATFVCGPGCEFRHGFRCELGPGAEVRIGARCVFTYQALIQCSTRIEIGDRGVFAYAATVVDGSHRFRDQPTPMLEQGYDFRPIAIGPDVSVMAKATVIASIGRGAFIGANAVVAEEIPPYSLAVGVPARVVERFAPEAAGAG